MIVPHAHFQPTTLRSLVLEFVTRDGTDHSIVETRVQQILLELAEERVEVDFDPASQSCNILFTTPSESFAGVLCEP